GRGTRGYSFLDDSDESAPKTWSPGAAREMYEPAFENVARRPSWVEAATARPTPPRPWEPGGWRSAAGYSGFLRAPISFPAAPTIRTPCAAAYEIASRSIREVFRPPRLGLT